MYATELLMQGAGGRISQREAEQSLRFEPDLPRPSETIAAARPDMAQLRAKLFGR
jgi:hypothetical protein